MGSQPVGVAVADLDGDGLLDVATANAGDGSVSVLFGHGDGTFDPSVSTSVAQQPVALAPIDGGLAVADSGAAAVVVVAIGGDRTIQVLGQVTVGSEPDAIAAGDINGDGATDLVVANRGDNSVTVLLATGPLSFSASRTAWPPDAGRRRWRWVTWTATVNRTWLWRKRMTTRSRCGRATAVAGSPVFRRTPSAPPLLP